MNSIQQDYFSDRTPSPPECDYARKHKAAKHAPTIKSHKKSSKRLCSVKVLNIHASQSDSEKSFVAYLHLPRNYDREVAEGREKTAVILMSGASGGFAGPSSMYISLADKLVSLKCGVPVLRMDYRYPARNKYCAVDVLAAMDCLQRRFAATRFVLVGWSFGSAPVMTIGGLDDRVVGCTAIAPQIAETEGIERVAARSLPLLLLHGTADRRLAPSCSKKLLDSYQRHVIDDMGFLQLFDGDDHALTQNSAKAEAMLCAFAMRCAEVELADDEDSVVLRKSLVGREERLRLMEEAGDLGEGEGVL